MTAYYFDSEHLKSGELDFKTSALRKKYLRPNQLVSNSEPFYTQVTPESALSQIRKDQSVFAIIRHGTQSKISHHHPLMIELGLPGLGDSKIEVWRTTQALTSGQFQQIHYRYNADFLFGAVCVRENDPAHLAGITKTTYGQIQQILGALNFPALVRMWNFFPAINSEKQKLERYRAFCLGRHQALREGLISHDRLPAATAIGSHTDGLVIYFIASKSPGIQIENPRQVSAFHYPRKYGPKSPSFSRATLKDWGNCQHLYISGTASIVGHAALHVNDVHAQMDETLTNIRCVIHEAKKHAPLDCHDIADMNCLRVFIRHPKDKKDLLARLRQQIGNQSDCQIIPVQGDICRSDLLLEIEGHYIGT